MLEVYSDELVVVEHTHFRLTQVTSYKEDGLCGHEGSAFRIGEVSFSSHLPPAGVTMSPSGYCLFLYSQEVPVASSTTKVTKTETAPPQLKLQAYGGCFSIGPRRAQHVH